MTDNVSRVQRGNKVPLVNLPNALTVARVVFVPLFVILALQDSWAMKWAAFVVFAIAAITDRFDGQLARSWNQITDFGRLVDPIADKALTLGGFGLLSYQGFLPWWLTILIAVRERGCLNRRGLLIRRRIYPVTRGEAVTILLDREGRATREGIAILGGGQVAASVLAPCIVTPPSFSGRTAVCDAMDSATRSSSASISESEAAGLLSSAEARYSSRAA